MPMRTHLGEGLLADGSTVLVTGHGDMPTLEAALSGFAGLPAPFVGWRIAPVPLRDWAGRHGAADLALDMALHLGDGPEIAVARPPAPDADPDNAIPRAMTPLPPPGASALHIDDRTASEGPGEGPIATIIDGAAVPGLEDRLPGEATAFACLFQGDALEELGGVAPWIAMLDPGSGLLREAMRAQACLMVAAPDGIDPIRKRLRKVSKLRGADASWVYFRFWDGAFRDWMRLHPEGPFPAGFFAPGEAVCLPQPGGDWAVATAPRDLDRLPTDGFLPAFSRFARMRLRRRFAERAAVALEEVLGRDIPLVEAARHYREARDAGCLRERALVRWMEASLRLEAVGRTPEDLARTPEMIAAQTDSDVHRAATLLDVVARHVNISS